MYILYYKVFYRLKQAERLWNKKIVKFFLDLCIVAIDQDLCILFYRYFTNNIIIIVDIDCNNVTLGAESYRSGSHVTIIIWNFTLVSLSSITIPHLAGLAFRATVLSCLIHSTTYLTPYCLCIRKIFFVVETIYVLSIYWGMRLSYLERHWMAWSLSGRLDVIKLTPSLCRHQPCHWYWSKSIG